MLSRFDAVRARLPDFQRKLRRTEQRVERALDDHGRLAVMYSGGKDSLVLAAISRRVNPEIPIVWSDDEAELPETLHAIERARLYFGEPFYAVAGPSRHGPFLAWSVAPPIREPLPGTIRIPGRASAWVAQQGWTAMVGTRAQENSARRRRGHRGPGWIAPIHDWRDEEVWAAVAGLELPLSRVYSRLVDAGWPRERCKTVPLVYALDGSYGPYRVLWPVECAAVERRLVWQ